MPCRKENYIFLEQSVTVDSKEVDALVSKIGEALQLHNNSSSQKAMSRLHGSSSSAAGGQRCIRLRSRSLRSSRASPYSAPGSSDQEWDHFKSSWNRKKINEDDPHQLLQELILSGNLIKEAVRRLQFSSEPPENDISKSVDWVHERADAWTSSRVRITGPPARCHTLVLQTLIYHPFNFSIVYCWDGNVMYFGLPPYSVIFKWFISVFGLKCKCDAKN